MRLHQTRRSEGGSGAGFATFIHFFHALINVINAIINGTADVLKLTHIYCIRRCFPFRNVSNSFAAGVDAVACHAWTVFNRNTVVIDRGIAYSKAAICAEINFLRQLNGHGAVFICGHADIILC